MTKVTKKQYLSDNELLSSEWNWERNSDALFSQLPLGSHKKVWWKCKEEHEWEAPVKDRSAGRGCPYCAGRKVLAGYNDLQTINPTVASEWNHAKNGNMKPDAFTANSREKVWWICSRGHSWKTAIVNRNRGSNCPYCSGRNAIPGENDLQTLNPGLAEEWDKEKNGDLSPSDVLPNSNKKAWWKCSKGHEWQATICSRNQGHGCPLCFSERHTSFPEYALKYYLEKSGIEVMHSYRGNGYEMDIFVPSKKVAIEYDGYYWHRNKAKKDIEKNQQCKADGIELYRIREGLPSLCDSSIDYLVQENQDDLSYVIERILNRIIGVKVDVDLNRDSIAIENLREHTEKENSIMYTNPQVASEWNYIKNGVLRPDTFTVYSDKKVWWKCGKGHEWQATVANRNSGSGCPYCAGRKVLIGYNDLQTQNPALVQEWDYTKNGAMTPDAFTANSGEKVWWKCNKGHSWQATIAHRNSGRGCPYCSGRKVLAGFNDLQTINPALTREWDYEQNAALKPDAFTANSGKKVWWKCSNGHSWQATIDHRNKGRGCPYCAGRYVISGENDLQTRNPVLASEWNQEKNRDLTPANVLPNTNKKVWWKCSKGHEWQATINSRNRGNGCPFCSGRKKTTSL